MMELVNNVIKIVQLAKVKQTVVYNVPYLIVKNVQLKKDGLWLETNVLQYVVME